MWFVLVFVIFLFLIVSAIFLLFLVSTGKKIATRYQFPNSEMGEQLLLPDVEFRCINLSFRPKKFCRMQEMLRKQNIRIERFDAVDGKKLNLGHMCDELLKSEYKKELLANTKHKGHLGATFSHIGLLQVIVDTDLGRTVVFEDDCVVHSNFKRELNKCLEKMDLLDPDWDILQLGFSCSYDSYSKCHLNDNVEIIDGSIIRLGYAIGLFGYVVNGSKGAQNVLDNVFPIPWHIDHHLQELNIANKISIYATIPNLVFHPGKFEISSFGEVYDTGYSTYVSDTNG